MERVENLQRLIFRIDEKIKKLENTLENMLNTHNAQMEQIIQIVSEIKEGHTYKGRQENRLLQAYNLDDEFY